MTFFAEKLFANNALLFDIKEYIFVEICNKRALARASIVCDTFVGGCILPQVNVVFLKCSAILVRFFINCGVIYRVSLIKSVP